VPEPVAAPTDVAAGAAALTWYHTLDLPGGVTTDGMFDLRACPAKLPLPASLAGKRCLDIGTCDGFWAFELERRGADEVVAIDLRDPTQRDRTVAARGASAEGEITRAVRTFAFAHAALGSKVQWREMNVYDLSPDFGTFDFVFMGSLLLHLRDPVRALEAVRSVVAGQFLSYDSVTPMLTLLAPRTPAAKLHGHVANEWWIPNKAGRVRELEAAGFQVERTGGISWVKRRNMPLGPRAFRRRPFSVALLAARGVPHTWALATPR
jgi:tRNA (mo5U34)-methyltransferase